MAQAEIGSLRVRLAAATAEFREGMRKAGNSLSKLSKKLGITARNAKIAGTAIGAAIGAAALAISLGVKRMLSEADKLTKLSRSIGVPVEELSALRHAAELSGASAEELGRAFRNVARNMQGAARAPTDFSRSLDALGIRWRDAEGNFIRADQLMLDVADRFSQMQDGAGKTALAMKILGEEMGPRLVSLLNSGSAGIRDMTAEAEQLGLTFDTKTGQAAERFNDNMDRIGKVFTGFTNNLTEQMLPVMELLSERFLNFIRESGILNTAVTTVTNTMKGLVTAGTIVHAVFKALRDVVGRVVSALSQVLDLEFSAALDELKGGFTDVAKNARETVGTINTIWSEWAATTETIATEFPEKIAAPIVQSSKAMKQATQEQNQAMQEGQRIMEEMRTPMEVLIARQTRLKELFAQGAINAQTFGRAMAQASAFSAKNMDALASNVSSNLSAIFGESKAVAIAQALINTYQGISKAIATYPPPISTAMAAIQAAAGFAQVASIRKTTKSGSGASSAASTTASSTGATAAAPPQQQQAVFIDLQGQSFGRDQVRSLIDSINDAVADGATIRVAP